MMGSDGSGKFLHGEMTGCWVWVWPWAALGLGQGVGPGSWSSGRGWSCSATGSWQGCSPGAKGGVRRRAFARRLPLPFEWG
eukprot:3833892-Lingulodinium_polyedra.AAC.1